MNSVGNLWLINHYDTCYCWWYLNKWEPVCAIHTASFIILFILVLPFCVFLLHHSSVLFWESSVDIKKQRFLPGPGFPFTSDEISWYSWELFPLWQRVAIALAPAHPAPRQSPTSANAAVLARHVLQSYRYDSWPWKNISFSVVTDWSCEERRVFF
jgi:hypothetical protein